MGLVEKIKNLCEEKDTTLIGLEREIGLGRGTIRKWETYSPAVDKLQKVAQYFNVSTDYLLGKTNIRNLDEASKILSSHGIGSAAIIDGKLTPTYDLSLLPKDHQESAIKLANSYAQIDIINKQSEDFEKIFEESELSSLKSDIEEKATKILDLIYSLNISDGISKQTLESASVIMNMVIESLKRNATIPLLSEESRKLVKRFHKLNPIAQQTVLNLISSLEQMDKTTEQAAGNEVSQWQEKGI